MLPFRHNSPRKRGERKRMKNIIRKSYENELLMLISENGGKCDTPEEIWNNLQYLTKPVTKFGETLYYLPLQIKKMLAYIADPDYRIEYKVEKSENICTVEAFFYWGDRDIPAGSSFVKRFVSQIYPDNSMTAEGRESVFEVTVRGLAASRAITDAGIGLQFYGDCFDMSPDKQEEAETAELERQKAEGKVPDIPSNNDKKVASAAKGKKTDVSKPVPEIAPETAVNETVEEKTVAEKESLSQTVETASEPIPEQPVITGEEVNSEEVDLTDAFAQIADKGTFAGYSLKDIYEKMPLNIAWLANKEDSAVRSAARKIALSDPNLEKRLK